MIGVSPTRPHLFLASAGRGAGGNVARPVKRNHAHGAEPVRVWAFRSRPKGRGAEVARLPVAAVPGVLPFSNCLTSDCQRRSVKKRNLSSTCFQAHLGRKAVGAFANQHHIRRLLHHRARQADGWRVRVTPATAPAFRVAPSMIAASKLVLALGGEDRAAPCVEEWIVFENPGRCFDGRRAMSLPAQNCTAGLD